MSDSEFISSDDSNNEKFPDDFIENIPDDSSKSENDDFSDMTDMNVSSLILEVGLFFLLGRLLLGILKFGLINKAFLFSSQRKI